MSVSRSNKPDSQTLIRWCAWFFMLNLLTFVFIGYQYLKIILNGIGNLTLPTSLNELDSSHHGLYLYLFFLFFSFTSYLIFFLILPAIISFASIYLFKNKWTVIVISISSVSLAAIYLLADSHVYALYRYHL